MEPQPTAWNTFPTDDKPDAMYKFTSVSFEFNKDLRQINRQTYSFLDWLGDCGGLLDALHFIAKIFVSPLSIYALNSKLVSNLVHFKKSKSVQHG